MSKTWRQPPVGAVKEPRPKEKGGHKNIYREAIEEEFIDFDDDLLLEIDDDFSDFNDDWIISAELENEKN